MGMHQGRHCAEHFGVELGVRPGCVQKRSGALPPNRVWLKTYRKPSKEWLPVACPPRGTPARALRICTMRRATPREEKSHSPLDRAAVVCWQVKPRSALKGLSGVPAMPHFHRRTVRH
jgi:hypothetical protein